jgi:hypothetical protein
MRFTAWRFQSKKKVEGGAVSNYRRDLVSALRKATGPYLSKALVTGRARRKGSKLVGSRLYILGSMDASNALQQFAIWCSCVAISSELQPDIRIVHAVRTRELWLRGLASDFEMAHARACAEKAIKVECDSRTKVASAVVASLFDGAVEISAAVTMDILLRDIQTISRRQCNHKLLGLLRKSKKSVINVGGLPR